MRIEEVDAAERVHVCVRTYTAHANAEFGDRWKRRETVWTPVVPASSNGRSAQPWPTYVGAHNVISRA